MRKTLVVDAHKVHCNQKCEVYVYGELPSEAGVKPGMCVKLNFWLYGWLLVGGLDG